MGKECNDPILWFSTLMSTRINTAEASKNPNSRPQPRSMKPESLVVLLQEERPLPGPESGLLSNIWKWIVREDIPANHARDFIGKGHVGGEKQGKGNSEDCSAMWFAVSGFIVMLLVSRLSRHDHSDSGSFLVAHALLNQGGYQWRGGTCGVSFWPFLTSVVVQC